MTDVVQQCRGANDCLFFRIRVAESVSFCKQCERRRAR